MLEIIDRKMDDGEREREKRVKERERETFKQSLTLMISMVPLVILVGMLRAWKKEVFSGPIPVF